MNCLLATGSTKPKKNRNITDQWTPECQDAFDARHKKSNNLPTAFQLNDSKLTNTSEIANEFNNFFSNIGQRISDGVSHVHTHYSSYLKDRHTNNIYFTPIDEREIINTTLKFTPKLSQGHDNISTKILRDTIHLTAAPLSHIFNQSLLTGIVPIKNESGKGRTYLQKRKHRII